MSSVGREIVQVGELLGEYVRGECPTLCVATSCPAQLDASNRCDGSKHKLLKLLLLFLSVHYQGQHQDHVLCLPA